MATDEDDIEVEQLLATGVIAPPRENKGKGKQVEGVVNKGHVIFTDDKEECESHHRTRMFRQQVLIIFCYSIDVSTYTIRQDTNLPTRSPATVNNTARLWLEGSVEKGEKGAAAGGVSAE
jgi:hypothetical protein